MCHYLRSQGLAEVFTWERGGGSYAATRLVTSFLQLQVPLDAQRNLGWLLVLVFAFYATSYMSARA